MSSHAYTALNTNQSDHVIPQGPEWTKEDNKKRAQQLEEHQVELKQKARIRAAFGLG